MFVAVCVYHTTHAIVLMVRSLMPCALRGGYEVDLYPWSGLHWFHLYAVTSRNQSIFQCPFRELCCYSPSIETRLRRLGGWLIQFIFGYFHCGSTLPAYLRIQQVLVSHFVHYVSFRFRTIIFDVPCASAEVCNYGQAYYHRAVYPVCAACPYHPLSSLVVSRPWVGILSWYCHINLC